MGEAPQGIYEPGTVLDDKLRVERLLGEGGMGVVYEVTHEMTRHRRALKLLHAQLGRQETNVERFLREASAAGKIGNAHIVETFDAGRLSSGEPFVLMELLEGESVADRLENGEPMSFSEVVIMFGQLCRGVQAAHDAGIVHRDLKPENVFLCASDAGPFVKILDFGVSKFDDSHSAVQQKTRTGATIGTPGYMSLEQIDDSADVDERSDVYALGVMLYETLTGEHPFPASSFLQLAKKVAAGVFTPPSEAHPGLPAALDGLMEELLAADRDARLGSAIALAERLESIADEIENKVVVASQREPEGSNGAPVSGIDETVAMEEPKTLPQAPASLEGEAEKSRTALWLAAAAAVVAVVVAAQPFTTPEPETARDGLTPVIPTASLAPPPSTTASAPAPVPSLSASSSAVPSVVPVPARPPVAKPPSDPDHVAGDDEL